MSRGLGFLMLSFPSQWCVVHFCWIVLEGVGHKVSVGHVEPRPAE